MVLPPPGLDINAKFITDISLGTFRMSKEHLKKIQKSEIFSDILYYPYITNNNISQYNDSTKIISYIIDILIKFISRDKIFLV